MMVASAGSRIDGPEGPASLELGQRIGRGHFGEVFQATHVTSGRKLAVKFPQSSLLDSGEAIAFKNDLDKAGRVRHPNVVEVVWVSPNSQPPYLVMEYVDGGTLQSELGRRAGARDQLHPDQVRLWYGNLLDGIDAINAVLLHRDIKPDNILIDGGNLKIADFGLAKILDAATRTQTFKEVGAMAYLAPEGWRGETNTIHRDMYAVGLVLFEIATLEYGLPIPAERSGDQWKETHLFKCPKRLADIRSDLPAAVEQLLLRLIAKRAQDRFATWAEVKQAFETAWKQTPNREPASNAADRIVRAVTASRANQQDAASTAELAAQREAEVSRAAEYKWEQLLDDVEASLQDLAKLGTIAVERKHGGLAVTVDSQPVAHARLLSVRPAHRFRSGAVTSAIAAFTVATGQGFNAVLRREGDDLYGEWQAMEWRRNYMFFVGRTVQDIPEPFALGVGDFATRLKLIDGMTSDIQPDNVGDIRGRFFALLADCIESTRTRTRR